MTRNEAAERLLIHLHKAIGVRPDAMVQAVRDEERRLIVAQIRERLAVMARPRYLTDEVVFAILDEVAGES